MVNRGHFLSLKKKESRIQEPASGLFGFVHGASCLQEIIGLSADIDGLSVTIFSPAHLDLHLVKLEFPWSLALELIQGLVDLLAALSIADGINPRAMQGGY